MKALYKPEKLKCTGTINMTQILCS